MRARIRLLRLTLIVLITLALSIRGRAESNATQPTTLEDDEDESLLDMTFDEFKERYRRLIPYVTFYVASNYANNQTPLPQNYAKDLAIGALLRKPEQLPLTRLNVGPTGPSRRVPPSNKYRVIPPSQEKQFIPSVQYDPRDIGGDNDYFTPVRYTSNVNYEDYPISQYQTFQVQKQQQLYPELTTPSSHVISHEESRYFTSVRPPRPFAANVRDYAGRKQPGKPIHVHEDYVLDYSPNPNAKTGSGAVLNYPVKEFAGLRYIPSSLQAPAQQSKIHEANGRQPASLPSPLPPPPIQHRNPNVNLNHIVEGLRLTELLPVTLNKDNIDNSIKTLVEILNILHNTRKEEFPQPQGPAVPTLPLPPAKLPQQLPGFDNFKLRPYTRPKVITETRFQATPNPLFITDDPERYKATGGVYAGKTKPKGPQSNYDTNSLSSDKIVESSESFPPRYNSLNDEKVEHKILPPLSGYRVNSLGNEKVVEGKIPLQNNYNNLNQDKTVEYYRPYVQGIPEDNKEVFVPTVRPQGAGVTEHSYEITEDLRDDILQDERFTLPTTSEAPKHDYKQSEKTPPRVPQSSLKYGVTRGKPNVDYPAYATIPETNFSCKEQRYKGFFGDPATGCQVWHYCDLNGGKSSFLCPNGTIFSQIALTCDWWFNVKCESTTQLYVLNERLYKYILPLMPKFPEDFTGPEVDRYLEIKFKEMEAKLREKKLKKQQEAKEKSKNKSQAVNENE